MRKILAWSLLLGSISLSFNPTRVVADDPGSVVEIEVVDLGADLDPMEGITEDLSDAIGPGDLVDIGGPPIDDCPIAFGPGDLVDIGSPPLEVLPGEVCPAEHPGIEHLEPTVCGVDPSFYAFMTTSGPEGKPFDDGGETPLMLNSFTDRGGIMPNFRGAANEVSGRDLSSSMPRDLRLFQSNEQHLDLESRGTGDRFATPSRSSWLGRIFRPSAKSTTAASQSSQATRNGKIELVSNTAARPVSDAERAYARELARIDTLRDRAAATGDVKLLEQADAMEAQLRSKNRAKPGLFNLFRRK